MIIGSDIMEEQGIEILYSDHFIVRDGVHDPLKLQGELLDGRYYERLFYMHTVSPILQQMKERQGHILNANYTKIDIDEMVDGLSILKSNKYLSRLHLRSF